MSGDHSPRLPEPDRPWMMRTYAGHSTAKASNELYRRNLAKGQTGLSVAFDLPTQTGYDPDDELARGEVGKVGVPISHRGDMAALMDGIPLGEMNTSMTINATAAWLLALYIVAAEDQGVAQEQLQGTTQNDIIKEFLARGTYAFPPAASMRLIADMIAYTVEHVPKWNPINICSYHLQEAGATPVQEIAYSMSNAIAVLDAAAERVQLAHEGDEQATRELMEQVFGRISFFVNAGVRFVEEHAKLRAMGILWEELGRERYGVQNERHLRFRYGVQVNSLGLTEAQPENNVQRIVLEALAVTLGRDARARAIQLPAWNEALGLPRPWDQQWSLRIQQVLAYETDILEYPDIFEGSIVMDGLVAELLEGARAEMAVVAEHGGAVEAVAYMKAALVDSHRERLRRIEAGEQVVVGQNRYAETEESPLTADAEGGILVVDPAVEAEQIEEVRAWRAARDQAAVDAALAELAEAAAAPEQSTNLMTATIASARAGATTGEWSRTLREVFGSYRAPTGVGEAAAAPADGDLGELREEVARLQEKLGRRPKILVGKPGLDGHSNGAEQIAVRARDSGMDVVYEGIRLTPAQIAASALQEGVHVIGLSILSGSHRELIPAVIDALHEAGVTGPGGRRRDHPRAGRRGTAPSRRRCGVHAEGLRHHTHHARHRRARRCRGSGGRRRRRPGGGGRQRLLRQRRGVSGEGAALGARLRERDLSAAPATLNLLESTAAERPRAGCGAAARGLTRRARRRGAGARGRRHRPARAPGKSTLLSALLAALARRGRSVAMLAVDPSSRRSGGSLLGDRARIEFDPCRQRGASSARLGRRAARRPRLGDARGGACAGGRLRRRRDRDRRRRPGRDRGRRRGRHRRRRRAAGQRRRLQFLKSGIMEIPDVLVVTKADLGQIALRTRRDVTAALRSLGSRDTQVVAVSSLSPPEGIEELTEALEEHRASVDVRERRLRARRANALADFAHEHGERGLRAIGGRHAAEQLLAAQAAELDTAALVAALEGGARR